VRTLLEEPQELGYRTIQWDGKDDSGIEVSSGVYFYKIEAGNFVECRKMMLLK
jgi:flagellar hook assembly protein FlgD